MNYHLYTMGYKGVPPSKLSFFCEPNVGTPK